MDQSVFEANVALTANSFCTILSRRFKLLYTKKVTFELSLCSRNMNDEALVFGNYSYILKNRSFLRNFISVSILMTLLKINMKHENFRVIAFLEINSAHAQISKTAKIAAVIVSFCRLTFSF